MNMVTLEFNVSAYKDGLRDNNTVRVVHTPWHLTQSTSDSRNVSYIWNFGWKGSWKSLIKKQKFLVRTNRLFSFDTTCNHRKRCLQQFPVATETCLPSRYIATIEGYTGGPTDSPLIRNGSHRKQLAQQLAYVFLAAVTFLPIHCLATYTLQTQRLMGGFMKSATETGSGALIYVPLVQPFKS